MKARNVSTMVLPALGIGTGMVASPKIGAAHPFLAKYPEVVPVILLIVALALFGVRKARGYAVGLGAVALVFLIIGIYNRVTGKLGVEAVPTDPITGKRLVRDIFGRWGLPDVYSDPYGEGI